MGNICNHKVPIHCSSFGKYSYTQVQEIMQSVQESRQYLLANRTRLLLFQIFWSSSRNVSLCPHLAVSRSLVTA